MSVEDITGEPCGPIWKSRIERGSRGLLESPQGDIRAVCEAANEQSYRFDETASSLSRLRD